MLTKGERRDADRKSRIYGHKTTGRSVLLIQEQLAKRADLVRKSHKNT